MSKPLILGLLIADLALGAFPAGAAAPQYGPAVSYGAGGHAHAVRIADLNGDGKPDLVVANALDATVSRLLGNGDGTFGFKSDYAAAVDGEPKSIAIGDLDGDGALDVVTANQKSNNVSVLLGNGDGSFKPKSDYSAVVGAHEAEMADVDEDGDLDIVVAGWGEAFVAVLLGKKNNGGPAGTFGAATKFPVGNAPHSVAIDDFDGDGKLDLAVANHVSAGSVSVLKGNGDGTFQAKQNFAVGSQPHSIRAGDLDGDGILDLVTANDASNNVSVLIGNGNGTFKTSVPYSTGTTPKSVFLADVNGDGRLDILTANIHGNYPKLVRPGGDTVAVLLGNGDGTFQAKIEYKVGQGPFSAIAGDVNGDGLPDLLTANWHDASVSVRLLGNDLAVGLADSPDPVGVGGTLSYSAQVSNNGPFAAHDVRLAITPASGTSLVSAGGCSPSGNTLVCDLGPLAVGGKATRAVSVKPAQAGGMNALALVTAAEYDASPGNNQASAATTVSSGGATPTPTPQSSPAPTVSPKASPAPTPSPASTSSPAPSASPLPQPGPSVSADLAVRLTGPKKIRLGRAGALARYLVTVRNKSKVAAPLTSVMLDVPEGVAVVGKPRVCAAVGAGHLNCDLGKLPKRRSKSLGFKLRVTRKEPFIQSVSASSAGAADPDHTNNSASKLIQVK